MADSFKSDEDWENDLKEFFELLESGTPASYIERMAELKARKGGVYASAIETEAMKRHKKGARKEANQLVPRGAGRSNLPDRLRKFSISVEDNTKELKSVYQQIRQEVLKLVHEHVFEPEKFNEDNLNRLLERFTELNKEYLETAPELILPEVDIYLQPKQPNETLLDYYVRLRVSRDRGFPSTPRMSGESTFGYYERVARQKYISQTGELRDRFGTEEKIAKEYLQFFSEILEHDLDWSSIEGNFFSKYMSLCNAGDEVTEKEIEGEIEKLKADVIKKKGLDYTHSVEKKASEHANKVYLDMLKYQAGEEERQREQSALAQQEHQNALWKERDEFCQQIGKEISAPIIGAMLSMNAANQAQFKDMSSQFEGTYRQLSLEVVAAINEQNGQYFERLGASLESSFRLYSEENARGLEQAATMICRAVNGPIPPRQSNEGAVDWFIRVYAQQNCIAPIMPRQEDEGFGAYLGRVMVQHNSVNPVLPMSPKENILNYLVRLKLVQNR
ncbi:Uncharacterised protein [uncultured archaeon]|nr:Uncharacterised protein [uncultured archaeon]